MNPNWTRWIVASLAEYLGEVAMALGIPLFVDGIDEWEPGKLADRAELRITGPFIREPSKGYYILEIGVHVLLTDLMGDTENPYHLTSLLGGFQEALTKPIDLYKYGPETGDDQSYFACLIPRGGKQSNKTYQYGQVSAEDRVRQASIDTQFYSEMVT